MKKKLLPLIVVIGLCAVPMVLQSKERTNEMTLEKRMDAVVQRIMTEYEVPGLNVGIWIPGVIEWEKSYGVADKETGETLTFEHHMRIGSVTKTFLGTALMQLVDKGKVSLDDKISKYVSGVPNGDKITLRHLMTMTSGLGNYTSSEGFFPDEIIKNPARKWEQEELLKIGYAMPIGFEPGKDWEYNNTNVILLGLVIEKVTGIDLPIYMEKNVLGPLNMKETMMSVSGKLPYPYALGYTKNKTGGADKEVSGVDPSWAWGTGNIISTFKDLKRWAKALGTGELLSKEGFKARTDWEKMPLMGEKGYHYGLLVMYAKGWITHTGDMPGFNTMVAYLPERDAIFVCILNKDAKMKKGEKEEYAMNEIFKELTEITMPDRPWVSKGSIYN